MNRKSIHTTVSIMILLFAACIARAQYHDGSITASPVRFEQKNDSLYLDMDISLSGVRVKSPVTIELTPQLISGEWKYDMPVISVKGRRSYKAYERSVAMNGITDGTPHIVVKGYGQNDGTVRYSHTVPYGSWMPDAGLDLACAYAGCGTGNLIRVSHLVDNVERKDLLPPVIHDLIIPRLAYVVPEVEHVKSREIRSEVRLDFVVNKTDIDPYYMNNSRELLKVREIIDELKNDPSIHIVELEIVGYASPEGSLANNKRLSEGRAMSLRNYLASQYDFPLSAYKITFGGENWDGLVEALESYPADYKKEVLAIIEQTPADQIRKSNLMAIQGGAPYRDMLKSIYPGLRMAVCKVDYHIKGYDICDAVEVFSTRPENLSLNEFYMVASTMREGSWDFIEVFETAVRMYPEDGVANLNAAVAALQNGNLESAERYLKRADTKSSLPEYANAAGALALLKKENETAERFFRQAAPSLDAARYNLEVVLRKNRQLSEDHQ